MLGGFLGAGKTTVLRHLLGLANGRRWAAVVNDLASVNIDAKVVEQAGASRVVELANGCVCCSVRDALGETVAELVSTGDYDHIFVETTGVADPRGVASLFMRRNAFGRSLGQFARLHALVTVIDAAQFLRIWRMERNRNGHRLTGHREPKQIFELMLDQVECADLHVLNKTDLITAGECAELQQCLHEFNPRAAFVAVVEGQVPGGVLPGPARFDPAATLGAARWQRVLQGPGSGVLAPGAAPTSHGAWQTLVFRDRRPFDEERLRAVVEQRHPGLLRAKGFYWIKNRPAEMGYLSVAGGIARWEFVGTWAAELLERGVIHEDEIPAAVRELWREPYGDRRQELVFIGVNLDREALQRDLESARA